MIKQNELESKLTQIFQLVLELLEDEDVSNLRRINEARWDSLAHVTLITALESEFDINLNHEDSDRLTSYQSTLLLLQEKTSDNA